MLFFPKMGVLEGYHSSYILRGSQYFMYEFMQLTSLCSLFLSVPLDHSAPSAQQEVECSLIAAFQNLCTYPAELNFNFLS